MVWLVEVLGFDYEDFWVFYVIQVSGDVLFWCCLMLGDEGFEFLLVLLGEMLDVWCVVISDVLLLLGDVFLQYKIMCCDFYDKVCEERLDGIDEVLMLNECGEVCEGMIINVFVMFEDGQFVMLLLFCGLLSGIQCEIVLENGVIEVVVMIEMFKMVKVIYMGNFLCGMVCVELV